MGTKRKKTRLDIHLHTPTSDGRGAPQDYVKAILKADLDGICITDHHVTSGEKSLEIAKAVRAAGFLCFMGCEYSTANGHLLIYGVDVAELNLGKYPPMQDVIWKVRERGGVAIPSHPFFGWKKKLGEDVFKLKDLIALETANGKVRLSYEHADHRAEGAAQTLELPGLGNSDAHHASRIGTCYTEFDGAIRRPADFIKALLSGEFRPVVNNRRVASQRRVPEAQSTWHTTPFRPSVYDQQLPLYPSGRGADENSSEADWEAYDRLTNGGLYEDLQEEAFFEDEDIPEHAFTDPFFVAEDKKATEILEEWAERSKRRSVRRTKKRGFFA